MAGATIDGRGGRFRRFIGSRALAWLIGINIGVDVLVWLFGLGGHVKLAQWLALPGSIEEFLRQPWGLVTYMFVQADFLHLLSNLLILYCFGRIALLVISESQLTAAYIGGGLAGGVAFLILSAIHPSAQSLLGASAAVVAIIVTAAVYRPNYRVNLFLLGSVNMVLFGLIVILLTLTGLGGGNSGGQIAHIGGILFGCGYGYVLRRGKDPARWLAGLGNKLDSIRAERHARKANVRRRADEELLSGIRGRLADRERLDELLDKIRASGYASLSRSERAELNALSNRLDSRD